MKVIEFYLTSEVNCFNDFAVNLEKEFQKPFKHSDEAINIPETVGTGAFNFFDIEDGIALIKINAVFNDYCKLYRPPNINNNYFILHFNLSEGEIFLKCHDQSQTEMGTDWKSSVFYSTTGYSSEFTLTASKISAGLTIIIHRSWFIKNLSMDVINSAACIRSFLMNKSCQGFLDLDLEATRIARELLLRESQCDWDILYLKGQTLKLIAFYLKKCYNAKSKPRIDFSDILRVMQIRERLEKTLFPSWPKIEIIAKESLMSTSKFIRLYKMIYGKNYYESYKEVRMKKAALMLEEGYGVTQVALAVGFSNTSHFSTEFKEYYHVEPRYYKDNSETK